MTHWRVVSDRPRSACALGRATLTMVPSRTTSSWVSETVARIHQRRVGAFGAGVGTGRPFDGGGWCPGFPAPIGTHGTRPDPTLSSVRPGHGRRRRPGTVRPG